MIFGLYGTKCECGKTANYVAPEAGYICDCGRFNLVPYNGGDRAYDKPDIGMTHEEFWKWVPQSYRDAVTRLSRNI